MRPKILHVENSCWDIFNFRQPFLEQMKEMGMEVVLVAPLDQYYQRIDRTLFDKFIRIKHLRAQSVSPFRDLGYLLELKNILASEKPDLAMFYTIKPCIYGGFASQWTATPAISVLTGLGYSFYQGGPLKKIASTLCKLAFRQLKKLVVLNEDDRNQLVDLGIVKPESMFIQPAEGVDLEYFSPAPKITGKDKFIFLYIGRLIGIKGLRELVEAVKILKSERDDFECWLVGDQSFSNPSVISKREVNEWVLRNYVCYFGATDDVRTYLRSADVVVLPSKAEGKPKVLQEAMAMEKPLITTLSAGCREMVEHGENGLLVPHSNAAALAEAMRYMMDLPAKELREMGQKSRSIVMQRYEKSVTKDIFKKLLTQVLNLEPQAAGTFTNEKTQRFS